MAHKPIQHIALRTARLACVAGLTASLTLGGALAAFPSPAFAASTQTLSELARLQEEVSTAAATFSDATKKAEELQGQVDDIADEVLEIEQVAMPAAQGKASAAVSNLYKMRTSSSGSLALLLNAESFDGFLSMNKYLGTIQNEQVDALKELNKLEGELNGKLEKLSKAKDEADAETQRASEALAQVQSAAAAMQEKANAEDAAEREAARKAAEQAAALAKQHDKQVNGDSGDKADGSGDNGAANGNENKPDSSDKGDSGNTSKPEQSKPEEPETEAEPSKPAGGWMSGVASHYGTGDGFMGGTTANGETVTETSMGIAMLGVPFGTRVEIRYGGRSVIAYVNDRGPYVHGRVIDMQPAVARALNFLEVGVATVQYRFL